MLHLAPVPHFDDTAERPPEFSAEVRAQLAGIRHALRLVDPFGGGPASDPSDDETVAAAWAGASKAASRRFDDCAVRTAGAASAGIDALLAARASGQEPNEAASQQLADEIRRGLEEISRRMRNA